MGVATTSEMLHRSAGPLIGSTFPGAARERRRDPWEFLIHKVAPRGHLGPKPGSGGTHLGAAPGIDSPHDPIIFDTGHQAYVHKMLTDAIDFATLRKKGRAVGVSVLPRASTTAESNHASAALSYADGLAKAFELTGHRNRHVVAWSVTVRSPAVCAGRR